MKHHKSVFLFSIRGNKYIFLFFVILQKFTVVLVQSKRLKQKKNCKEKKGSFNRCLAWSFFKFCFIEYIVVAITKRGTIKSKMIYQQGKGPIYELLSSSQSIAVVPLVKIYMQFFLAIFLGWVMLPHFQATSTDHGGPRTSDLSIDRGRCNHFSTHPRSPIRV